MIFCQKTAKNDDFQKGNILDVFFFHKKSMKLTETFEIQSDDTTFEALEEP